MSDQLFENNKEPRKMDRNACDLFIALGIWISSDFLHTKAQVKKNARKSVRDFSYTFWRSVLVWEEERKRNEDGSVFLKVKDYRESHRRNNLVRDVLLNLIYKEYISLVEKDNKLVEGPKVMGLNINSHFYKKNRALCFNFFQCLQDMKLPKDHTWEWMRVKTGEKSTLKVLVLHKG